MLKTLIFLLLTSNLSSAQTASDQSLADDLLKEIKQAYASSKWSDSLYLKSNYRVYEKRSVKGRPLIYFVCGEQNKNTTLLLSGVHGDEITPVYYGLRLVSWVKGEPDLCRDHRIIIAPVVNPDGVLAGSKGSRMNANGVDLNRNFPTEDFKAQAVSTWKTKFKSDPRRNPGEIGGSEPETQFQEWLIETYKPDKILSVHSPLNFYDYDGPEDAISKAFTKDYLESCKRLKLAVKKQSGSYSFLKFGFFVGSLGNFAGKERGIPTLTLELPTTNGAKAKSYFEMLRQGTRALIINKVEEQKKQ